MNKPLLNTFNAANKNQLKHFFVTLLCCLVLFTAHTEKASASHSAGGYLSYEWLYGTTYRFTVTFYKDCGGATPAPTQMEIDVNSSCGAGSVDAPQLPNTGQEIGYPCPNVTTCDGGTNPGYRKFVYQVDAVFNVVCTDWVISFKPSLADNQVLGRNALITTLNTPLGNMYTQTRLDNINYPTNDAVYFTNDPILFICAGQQQVFNLGATDDDGDSLTYQLTSAMQAAGVPVSYVFPLSAANPLFPGAGAVTINNSTGDITINTNVIQVGVIDILVSEYKNGIFMGSVVLDIQVVVQSCTDNYPSLTGINGTPVFTDTVCPGSVVSFPVYSGDPDPGQIVTMTWNNGIPLPATFSITGSPYPTGTFTWATTLADARPSPYIFTVTVRDNACPINGSQTYAYSIYVIGGALSVNPSAPVICNGGTVSLTASGGSSYSWSPSAGLSDSTGATVTASPSSTTIYTVVSSGGAGCNNSSTVTVTVNSVPVITISPPAPSFCIGQSVPLTASGGSTYIWSPVTGLSSGSGTTVTANPTATTTYKVTGTAGSGCTGTSTATITVNPLPVVNAGPDANICQGASASINVTGPPQGSVYTWTPYTNLTCGNCQNPSASPSITTTYIVSVTDTLGCSSADTIVVNVTPLSAVAGPDTTICSGSVVQLTASGGTNYSWSPTTNLTDSTIADPFAIPDVNTTYTVTVSTGNCVATATVDISVHPILPTPNIIQKGDSLFCTTDPRYVSYQWYDSTTLVPGATDTFFVATHSGNYNVAAYDDNGCSISVGVNIILIPTGIQNYWNDSRTGGISIWPNPASNKLIIDNGQLIIRSIDIYNVLGEAVQKSEIRNPKSEIAMDVSNLTPGVYFIEVVDQKNRQIAKFVKE